MLRDSRKQIKGFFHLISNMEFKRLPFVEREIKDLDKEKDVNVCILGRIIDITENVAILDDGTGTLRIVFSELPKDLKVRDIIRVFGQLVPVQGELEIRAEFYQKMNGLDLELYKKFRMVSNENV